MGDLLRLTGRDKSDDMRNEWGKEPEMKDNEWQADARETDREAELLRLVSRNKKTVRRESEWKERGKKEFENRTTLQEGREKREKNLVEKRVLFRNILTFAVIAAGGPVFCWFLYGERGIKRYWPLLVALDVLTVIFLFVRIVIPELLEGDQKERDFVEREDKNSYDEKESRHEWQMVFQEESENSHEIPVTGNHEVNFKHEECTTALLTEPERPLNSRCLRSTEPGIPDIIISYVPFIIGKQEGLADYVLARDTVSRLHARIDREGEEYRITDLNSTNGTTVGGRLLEMNETAVLLPGEEVYIANIGFIFTQLSQHRFPNKA